MSTHQRSDLGKQEVQLSIAKDASGASEFDGHHRWLGIPKREQPPHHYRLLGISPFEDDPDVIATAAGARLTTLRQQQSGPHFELCTRLLNEVSQVRLCLLNPDKKAVYDARLSATLRPAPESVGEGQDEFAEMSFHVGESVTRRRNDSSPLATIVASLLGGISAWLLLWQLNLLPSGLGRGGPQPAPPKQKAVAKASTRTALPKIGDAEKSIRYVPEDASNPFGIEGRLIVDEPADIERPDSVKPPVDSISLSSQSTPSDELISKSSQTIQPESAPILIVAGPDSAASGFGSPKLQAQLAIQREKEIGACIQKHDEACRVARKILLANFDQAISHIKLNKRLTQEVRIGIAQALKAEKGTFETTGCVPFSLTMRTAMQKYLKQISSSEQRVYKAYDIAVSAFQNDKDDKNVALMLRRKYAVPRIVGKWECHGVNFRGPKFTWILYSNFRVNPTPDENIAWPDYWNFKGSTIVITNNGPAAPKGGFKDVCTVRADGQQFTARNQHGGIYVGRRID